MKIVGTRIALMVSAAAGALAVASPGAAAQGEAGSAARMADAERIVVTARRKEENLQDVPVAVSVVSQEGLKSLVVNDIQDWNKLASGLQVGACVGDKESCFPIIRAQSGDGATPYFAEVANFPSAYYDLQSVQVLKGPQGTLFGSTITGGAILFEPRKPQENELNGYVDVSLGNFDYRAIDAAIGGALIEDKLLMRVAGRLRKRDGYVTAFYADGRPPEDWDDVNEQEWRVSIVARPFEGFENYTVYAGGYRKVNGPAQQLRYADPQFLRSGRDTIPADDPETVIKYEYYTGAQPPAGMSWGEILRAGYARQNAAGPYAFFTNYPARQGHKRHGIVNQTRWDIADNLAIRNIYGLYWSQELDGRQNPDGLSEPLYEGAPIRKPGCTDYRDENCIAWIGGWPSRRWSNETQLLGTLFDNRVDWQGGFYYAKSESRDFQHAMTGVRVFEADFTRIPMSGLARVIRSKSVEYAVYGQANFSVTDRLRVTGGVRHSWDKGSAFDSVSQTAPFIYKGVPIFIQYDDPQLAAGAPIVETPRPLTTATTYTVSADYKLNDNTLVYAAHRTGYAPGGINNAVAINSPLRVYGPERIKDIEFGVKSNWTLGGVVGTTNIAIYRNWYDDIQRTDYVHPNVVTGNVAKAIIQGFEFDTAIEFTDWFELVGSLTYTDAYYQEWMQTQRCASEYWRPPCQGVPGSTTFVIDHAEGVVYYQGMDPVVTNPDRFRGVAKWKWSIQPQVNLDRWLGGEDVSIGANVYYQSGYATSDPNYTRIVGIDLSEQGVFGEFSHPYFTVGYAVADLRADWRHIKGTAFSLAARATNVTDKLYNQGPAASFPFFGSAPSVIGAPHMWYVEGRWEF
ncbi:MAG: TonB-dependent receptor [Amphiplicatus sp.]